MEKQVTKDGSGSDSESDNEPKPWRCEANMHLYERNKREVVLTEAELEEIGSDLNEFMWTYDDDKSAEYYEAQVKEATEDLLSYIREKHKRLDVEAEAAKTKSKSQ